MELLKHIAKQHSLDQCQEKESVEETGIKDLNEKDTEKEEKDKDILLSESMLDDVLLKGYWISFHDWRE